MKKTLFVLSAVLMLTVSCSDSQKSLQEKISATEAKLFDEKSGIPNSAKVREMLQMYDEYFRTYREDTLNALYLFKSAELSTAIKEYQESIRLYDSLILVYPQSFRVPDAMFMKAFVYDNYLQRYENARESYQAFLDQYPEHHLARDAAKSLQFVGKTNEEILEILMSNPHPDSVRTSE